jgi:UPF0716 family protein affecting phage T7 exclusion
MSLTPRMLLVVLIDTAALILVIVGGVIGTKSGAGVALIVVGIILLQVTWIPLMKGRRNRRTRGAVPESPANRGI